MCSFGGLSGKNSRCLSLFTVMMAIVMVMLMVVPLEGADACGNSNSNSNSNGHGNGIINNNKFPRFDVYDLPAIQWACEPFLEMEYNIDETTHNTHNNHNNHNLDLDLNPMKEKTRELCMKLRGGKLGKGSNSNNVDDNSDVVVIDDNNAEVTTDNSSSSSTDDSSITVVEIEKENATDTTETSNEDVNGDGDVDGDVDGDDEATTIDNNNESTDTTADDDLEPELELEPELSSSTEEEKDQNDDEPSGKYTFSVLQENDGHETDPDGIPSRYLKMQNNRRDLAVAAFENTLRWRKEYDIDNILARPHPKYDVAKAVFPHYFCGRDDTKHVILLQRPGLLNTKIAHKNNLSGEELLFHYIYVMEYLWRIVDPASDATMTSIIDLTEMNMSILRKREQLRIGSLFLSTMDAHFPQRSHRTFLINAPKWFGALYKIASPLLRESTKEKIQILSKGKEQDEVLQHLLQDCPIPEGTKSEHVPAGIMEEELRNFCLARLDEAGATMQPVEPV